MSSIWEREGRGDKWVACWLQSKGKLAETVTSDNLEAGVQSQQTLPQRVEVECTLLLKPIDPGAKFLVLVCMREAHGAPQVEELIQGA
jgi:hypothetical protein